MGTEGDFSTMSLSSELGANSESPTTDSSALGRLFLFSRSHSSSITLLLLCLTDLGGGHSLRYST